MIDCNNNHNRKKHIVGNLTRGADNHLFWTFIQENMTAPDLNDYLKIFRSDLNTDYHITSRKYFWWNQVMRLCISGRRGSLWRDISSTGSNSRIRPSLTSRAKRRASESLFNRLTLKVQKTNFNLKEKVALFHRMIKHKQIDRWKGVLLETNVSPFWKIVSETGVHNSAFQQLTHNYQCPTLLSCS